MRRIVGLGVVMMAVAIAGFLLSEDKAANPAPVSTALSGPISGGPLPGPRGPHRFGLINGVFSFQCADGGSFIIQMQDPDELVAIFTDGANGRAFNLRLVPSLGGHVYDDGTLHLNLEGTKAYVNVAGERRYSDCQLWSHSYTCSDGTFWLDTRQRDISTTVFWDGTNGKFFTLQVDPVSPGIVYTDGVIVADITAGTVVVDGKPYFADCVNADPSF